MKRTIMTVSTNPWTAIKKPASDFSVLRVDPAHPHDFFWGKDTQGYCLMLLKIDEQHKEYLEKKSEELRGVRTDIRLNQATGEHFFILSLRAAENADIFYRLCVDLIASTREIKGQKAALEIIHSRLKRWKSFLSRGKSHLLSPQEVQGLFAELSFFHECLERSMDSAALIAGWLGPLNSPHDFVLGNYAVEIKSVSGAHKNTVRISSENQLASHLEKLFLHVYFLAEFVDCKQGVSLNQLVSTVRAAIIDSDNRDLFDSRLYETGYMEFKEYDAPCYSVSQQKTFEVKDGFPRIIPETLTNGLSNVSYDLALNTLQCYISEVPLTGGMND
jgi:hypothetical protein